MGPVVEQGLACFALWGNISDWQHWQHWQRWQQYQLSLGMPFLQQRFYSKATSYAVGFWSPLKNSLSARSHELLPRKCSKISLSRPRTCRSSPQDISGGCFPLTEGPGCKKSPPAPFSIQMRWICYYDRGSDRKIRFIFDPVGRLDRIWPS